MNIICSLKRDKDETLDNFLKRLKEIETLLETELQLKVKVKLVFESKQRPEGNCEGRLIYAHMFSDPSQKPTKKDDEGREINSPS